MKTKLLGHICAERWELFSSEDGQYDREQTFVAQALTDKLDDAIRNTLRRVADGDVHPSFGHAETMKLWNAQIPKDWGRKWGVFDTEPQGVAEDVVRRFFPCE